MKLALRYIPTEVWADVYPWISRRKMGRIVHRFRNRKFAEFLQFYLHDWGKRTMKTLWLFELLFAIPQTPIPENIKFFEHLAIRHFDSQTLDFLHRISTLFLINDVNLHLPNLQRDDPTMANLRTVLGHLSPMLHGIHSLSFNHSAIPLVEQHFGPKLAHVKMLTFYLQSDPATIQASINFALNWLTSEERDYAEPRFLEVYIGGEQNFQQFCMAVRQQFLWAVNSCTFAIELHCYDIDAHVAHFHLENGLDEQLNGQYNEAGNYQIHRHKMDNFAREQLQEWANKTVEKSNKSSVIELYRSAIVGQIDADASADEVDDNAGEEADDQPSTSNMP